VFGKHLVVRDGRRAVVRYDGRVVDVLDVGRHRLVGRAWRRSVEVLDLRQQLLARRAGATALLTPLVGAEVAHLGIGVAEVSVRDVSLPGELRRALLATATATQEGQAALERARGEVAATRALANAARTLAESPALLQLRTVQEAARSGSTVVLHVGES